MCDLNEKTKQLIWNPVWAPLFKKRILDGFSFQILNYLWIQNIEYDLNA